MGFKNTIVNNIIIGGGGDFVVNERLTYDRPEVVPAQTAKDTIIPRASETVRAQQEFVIAALLARAEETSPTPIETIRFGQQGISGSPKRENESESDKNRRESFKARHAKNIAKGKMSAAFWANKVKW